jgi:hypothetical protein
MRLQQMAAHNRTVRSAEYRVEVQARAIFRDRYITEQRQDLDLLIHGYFPVRFSGPTEISEKRVAKTAYCGNRRRLDLVLPDKSPETGRRRPRRRYRRPPHR